MVLWCYMGLIGLDWINIRHRLNRSDSGKNQLNNSKIDKPDINTNISKSSTSARYSFIRMNLLMDPPPYTDISVQSWIDLVADYSTYGLIEMTPVEAVAITYQIPEHILQGIINGQIIYQQTGITQPKIKFIPQRRNQ